MQGDTMSTGWIHVLTVIPRICSCVKQILIGWKLILRYMVQWQQIHRTAEGQRTNSLSLYDVTAATEPCTQKSTFNQSELVKCTHKFAEWQLDVYHSIGHVSPCIVWTSLISDYTVTCLSLNYCLLLFHARLITTATNKLQSRIP